MLYFDTSFMAPLILEESSSERVETFIAKLPVGQLCISHWTRVELASLISREVRMGSLAQADALAAIGQFDELVAESCQVLVPGAADYKLAKEFVQHFATKLRAGDALHLAVASNQGGLEVLTLDQGLVKAAKLLGLKARTGIRLPAKQRL